MTLTGQQIDAPPHANVVAALAAVMSELPGIGRDQQASAQQGGYAYRGIEQITQHVQPLLAKHGVVFVPHVHSYEVRDLTVNNKPWTDVYEMVSYTVYGPGGPEDKIEVGPILAIGRDNSDKGANKCATQAFKYALLQTLCISDAKDDGDATSHEADRPSFPCKWCDFSTEEREAMREHLVSAHDFVRQDDGSVVAPKEEPPTPADADEAAEPSPEREPPSLPRRSRRAAQAAKTRPAKSGADMAAGEGE